MHNKLNSDLDVKFYENMHLISFFSKLECSNLIEVIDFGGCKHLT